MGAASWTVSQFDFWGVSVLPYSQSIWCHLYRSPLISTCIVWMGENIKAASVCGSFITELVCVRETSAQRQTRVISPFQMLRISSLQWRPNLCLNGNKLLI